MCISGHCSALKQGQFADLRALLLALWTFIPVLENFTAKAQRGIEAQQMTRMSASRARGPLLLHGEICGWGRKHRLHSILASFRRLG